VDQFCAAALSANLREIGFATHLDTDTAAGDAYVVVNGRRVESASDGWLWDYESTVRAAGDRFAGDLKVRLGVELDYYPGVEQELPDDFRDTGFDFVIGSVHLINHKALSVRGQANALFARYSPEMLADVYYGVLMQCVESGLCDILGHVDIYRRYGEQRWRKHVHETWRDHVAQLSQAMIRRNIGFEVNTSSWRKGLAEPMPESPLARALIQAGVSSVTVGSDAHRPEDVGSGVGRAISMLKAMGVDALTTYEHRHPVRVVPRQDA
jgi:histidinol-phosphatase (PHP family)